MKRILIVCLSVAIVISACDKDKSGFPITKENVAGTYQLVALSSTPDYEQPVDKFSALKSCEKDNLTHLNLDGTYVYEDAGETCGSAPIQTDAWKLVGTKIFVYGNEWGSITKFDSSTLELTRYDKDLHATLIITLKKI